MSLSMYQASVPVFSRALRNSSTFLKKAEADATTRGVDPATLLAGRLAPDMFPLPRQIQIAADVAKRCTASLAGLEAPVYADDETSFEQLYARIDKTLAYIEGVDKALIEGSEARDCVLKVPNAGDMHFAGWDFLQGFALPNVYFHVTVAYAILRNQGAPLGKMDFLGGI